MKNKFGRICYKPIASLALHNGREVLPAFVTALQLSAHIVRMNDYLHRDAKMPDDFDHKQSIVRSSRFNLGNHIQKVC